MSQKLDDHHVNSLNVPIIDLKDINLDSATHTETVEKIRDASEKWGFFWVTNHGIPQDVLNKVLEGVHSFHEQPKEVKMEFFSRDKEKKVRYDTNFSVYNAKVASWRDTLACVMAPNPPPPETYPDACREILLEYSTHVLKLGEVLFKLLSEALGLPPTYLKDMGCIEGHAFGLLYYPICPEPDEILGNAKHCDPDFLTILVQDQIGGLQVLQQDDWVDVPPLEGGLIINIGDLLQLVSNDKFKSIPHRVLANRLERARVSVPCLFIARMSNNVYGPIKELLSEDNPALYKETLTKDYLNLHSSMARGPNDPHSALAYLRLKTIQ